jgi:hypothetical protein
VLAVLAQVVFKDLTRYSPQLLQPVEALVVEETLVRPLVVMVVPVVEAVLIRLHSALEELVTRRLLLRLKVITVGLRPLNLTGALVVAAE